MNANNLRRTNLKRDSNPGSVAKWLESRWHEGNIIAVAGFDPTLPLVQEVIRMISRHGPITEVSTVNIVDGSPRPAVIWEVTQDRLPGSFIFTLETLDPMDALTQREAALFEHPTIEFGPEADPVIVVIPDENTDFRKLFEFLRIRQEKVARADGKMVWTFCDNRWMGVIEKRPTGEVGEKVMAEHLKYVSQRSITFQLPQTNVASRTDGDGAASEVEPASSDIVDADANDAAPAEVPAVSPSRKRTNKRKLDHDVELPEHLEAMVAAVEA